MRSDEPLTPKRVVPDIHSDDFMRLVEEAAASDSELTPNPYNITTQKHEFVAWHKGYCAAIKDCIQ